MFNSKFFVICAKILGIAKKSDRAGERLFGRWHKFHAHLRSNNKDEKINTNPIIRDKTPSKRHYGFISNIFKRDSKITSATLPIKRFKNDVIGDNMKGITPVKMMDGSSADNRNKLLYKSASKQDDKIKCKRVKEPSGKNSTDGLKCPSPPCPPPCPCPPFCKDSFFTQRKRNGNEQAPKAQKSLGETILPKSYPLECPQPPPCCQPCEQQPVKCATPSCPPPQAEAPPPPPECPPPVCLPPCCTPPCCPRMEALQFDPCCRSLNFYLINAPTCICKDEVLVQIVYSGVCDSDLAIMDGRLPCKNGPVILGHEFSGIACAVGSNVQHIKCGDCIAVNPYTGCQICRYCTRGKEGSCLCEGLNDVIGVHRDGGWAEFIVVKANQAHKLPPNLALDQAALLEPLSCVLSGLSKLELSEGLDILIQGAGLSASLFASVLHYKGFKRVVLCEKDETKRKQFECLKTDFPIEAPEKLCGICADIVIDCTCSTCSVQRSFRALNPNGQLCIFGQPSPSEEATLPLNQIAKKELKIFGSLTNAYNFSPAVQMAEGMGCRYLDCNKLGIQTFQLGQYEGAFQMLKCGEIGGILFRVDSSK